jgi:hypothetical protein
MGAWRLLFAVGLGVGRAAALFKGMNEW